MSEGQTTYSLDNSRAVAGQLDGIGPRELDSTLIATVDLDVGVAVRMKSDGSGVEPCADDTGDVVGITCYGDLRQGTYPQGGKVILANQPVRLLRKGRIWMKFDGLGTPAPYHTLQLGCHGATGATTGFATATGATAGTVRATNGALTSVRAYGSDLDRDASTKLLLVEVNLPITT